LSISDGVVKLKCVFLGAKKIEAAYPTAPHPTRHKYSVQRWFPLIIKTANRSFCVNSKLNCQLQWEFFCRLKVLLRLTFQCPGKCSYHISIHDELAKNSPREFSQNKVESQRFCELFRANSRGECRKKALLRSNVSRSGQKLR
jgi:hypothetical protein